MKLLVVYTPSHQILKERYFLPSLQDDYELCQYEYDQGGTGRFMEEDWSRGIMFKCERIIDTIRENPGEVFVYADVDLRFFAPTRQSLLQAIRDCDIACQLDDPAGNFCSGFFVLRAGPRTLALWEGVRRGIRSEGRDQLAFNRLVRSTDTLRIRHLPVQYFGAGTFTGRHVTAETAIYIPPSPIMFHANWIMGVENKLKLLDRVGSVIRGGLIAIIRNNWTVSVKNKPGLLDRIGTVVRSGWTTMVRNNPLRIEQNGYNRHDAAPSPTLRQATAEQRVATPSLPTSVCLELSSACQLECPACPTGRGFIAQYLGARFLCVDDFRRFLDLHPAVNHIELSNWGELFLNKDLPDILRLAHERGVALNADNGVNLNTVRDGVLEALVKYRLRSLTCSLDGASQTTYARYRVKGDFDRVIEHVRQINRYKAQYSTEYPRLRWQFVAFGHNEHEIAQARRMARKLGMDFYLKLSWEDLYTDSFSPVSDRELIRRESGLAVADRDEFERRYGRNYVADTCRQLWGMPRIHADGRLLGCSINYWGDYGNVFEQGLEACLQSDRMSYARAMVSGKSPPRADIPCTTCKVYRMMQRQGVWMGPDGPIPPGPG